jgi:hypothetical protein
MKVEISTKNLLSRMKTPELNWRWTELILYNEFKLGQRVYVKCKGMYIGDYNNLVQLGYLFDGGIGRLPEVFIPNHLFRDSLPGAVPEPQVISAQCIELFAP